MSAAAVIRDPYALPVVNPYAQSSARRSALEVTWQSKDISRYIEPYLLGLSYADNLTSAADDLTLDLQDRDGLWSGDWRPQYRDTVEVRLKAEGWFTGATNVRLGKFSHDKIGLSGPPAKVTIKAVSAPLATGLRRRKRTRMWKGVTLRQIAQDIANRAGLTLLWDGAAGTAYKARVQSDKSDLEFLDELAKEIGRVVKVTEDQIVIFDEFTRDATASSGTIELGGENVAASRVISWAFDGDDSDHYGSCHISFYDPRTGKTHKGEFVDPENPDGQTLELRMPLESIAEAKDRAKAMLRNANRFANKGKLTTVGDPGLVAGVTFDLAGAASLNGKFIVTRAEHKPIGGYTVNLDVRRCLEGY